MTYGLLTRRTDGTSIITPETFTVRVVDVFKVTLSKEWGASRAKSATPNKSYSRPKVRKGMFATCTPADPHTITPTGRDQVWGWGIVHINLQGAQIPRVTCGDGTVVLSAPITRGKFGGNFYIHIYEYL